MGGLVEAVEGDAGRPCAVAVPALDVFLAGEGVEVDLLVLGGRVAVGAVVTTGAAQRADCGCLTVEAVRQACAPSYPGTGYRYPAWIL